MGRVKFRWPIRRPKNYRENIAKNPNPRRFACLAKGDAAAVPERPVPAFFGTSSRTGRKGSAAACVFSPVPERALEGSMSERAARRQSLRRAGLRPRHLSVRPAGRGCRRGCSRVSRALYPLLEGATPPAVGEREEGGPVHVLCDHLVVPPLPHFGA